MIVIFGGTFINTHEVARADRFSDKMYGNNLRRVKNFTFGTPLPRAGEGLGVRARRDALAMRKMVPFALHKEMVATLSGGRLGL